MFNVEQWKQTILNDINIYSNNVYLLKQQFYFSTLYGIYVQI